MSSISTEHFESNYFNISEITYHDRVSPICGKAQRPTTLTYSVLVLLVFGNRLGCFVISFILCFTHYTTWNCNYF